MAGDEKGVGLLDYRFVNYLNEIARNVECAGGKLISKEAIAFAIYTWEAENHLPAKPPE